LSYVQIIVGLFTGQSMHAFCVLSYMSFSGDTLWS